MRLTLCTTVKINVEVFIPNSKAFLDKLKGPRLKKPIFIDDSSKIFHFCWVSNNMFNSLGSLKGLWRDWISEDANKDKNPIWIFIAKHEQHVYLRLGFISWEKEWEICSYQNLKSWFAICDTKWTIFL